MCGKDLNFSVEIFKTFNCSLKSCSRKSTELVDYGELCSISFTPCYEAQIKGQCILDWYFALYLATRVANTSQFLSEKHSFKDKAAKVLQVSMREQSWQFLFGHQQTGLAKINDVEVLISPSVVLCCTLVQKYNRHSQYIPDYNKIQFLQGSIVKQGHQQ